MNFRQIKYFLTVVEHMNITKAAKSLYVSQQALSEQIRKLEEEVGQELFVRAPRLQLTDAGICMHDKAKKMLAAQNELLNELSSLGGQCSGSLTIGIGRTLGLKLLPQILPGFYEAFPLVKPIVTLGNYQDLSYALEDGTIEILIGGKTMIPANASQTLLFEETFGLLVPHKVMEKMFPENTEEWINRFSEELDITKFADAPFLFFSERNHIYRRYLQKNRIIPNVILELNDTEILIRLAMKEMGVCLCASQTLEVPENMHYFPIKKEDLGESIVIASSLDTHVTNAMRAFVRHTKNCFIPY